MVQHFTFTIDKLVSKKLQLQLTYELVTVFALYTTHH